MNLELVNKLERLKADVEDALLTEDDGMNELTAIDLEYLKETLDLCIERESPPDRDDAR